MAELYLVCEGLAQHVLVEGAGEVGIDKLAIMQSLAHDTAHKLEEVQMVGSTSLIILDHAVLVGLEGGATQGHWHKEGEVWVEDLSRHDLQRHGSHVLVSCKSQESAWASSDSRLKRPKDLKKSRWLAPPASSF